MPNGEQWVWIAGFIAFAVVASVGSVTDAWARRHQKPEEPT